MIKIIPAIDIINGECVRLSQGDYNTKNIYYKDPTEIAKRFEGIGLERVHIVDLDGAKFSSPKNLRVVEKIKSCTNLTVQFGGGIKSAESLKSVLDAGVTYAICGSIAITEEEIFRGWLERYSDNIILGADIKDGMVATHGWLKSSDVSIDSIIEKYDPRRVICTDISKDGMLQGPNFELYNRLQTKFDECEITVSGGISCFDDIVKLNEMELRSVIVGKAIYEGRISLKEIEKWLLNE